eukprot:6543469-Pyramimonas_sp.AAC.1
MSGGGKDRCAHLPSCRYIKRACSCIVVEVFLVPDAQHFVRKRWPYRVSVQCGWSYEDMKGDEHGHSRPIAVVDQ